MMRREASTYTLAILALVGGCGPQSPAPRAEIDAAQQLLVVITPGWTSTVGTMTRFERATPAAVWSRTESPVPVVVGRTGIAWGVGFDDVSAEGPHKHEGDGKAPAGIFPLDTAFGFAARDSAPNVLLHYAQLLATTECVDDTGSAHYNTLVDRMSVPDVDWKSAERMREVPQYKIGVIVGYNGSPPVRGRGSCIFLHIWAGPGSHTAGCTAFDEGQVRAMMLWLDPKRRPLLVQLTAEEYGKLRTSWKLPAVGALTSAKVGLHHGPKA